MSMIVSSHKRSSTIRAPWREADVWGNDSIAVVGRWDSRNMLQSRPRFKDRKRSQVGGVEMWRGGCRLNISVAASFVWRCLSGSTMTPFPHPAHRTGQADFPHPALGQDFTPSLSRFRVQRLLQFLNTRGVDR